MELGKTIAKLRRERGLTQEQLGKALFVSGQAVSKWEKGGTPDPDMLPAIADRLGVTIDTLFGRSNEPTEDMEGSLLRYIAAFPKEKRMFELFRLLCATFQHPYYVDGETLGDLMDALFRLPVKTCYSTDIINHTDSKLWLRSSTVLDEGIQLGVPAEDCPMFLLLPEPEGGYASNFTDNKQYRTMFSALALPGALEILRRLYAHQTGYSSAKVIARASGVPIEDAERALTALTACHMIKKIDVELEDAPVQVFMLNKTDSFVPFMLLARWLCDGDEAYFCKWDDRTKPLLKEVASDENKECQSECPGEAAGSEDGQANETK